MSLEPVDPTLHRMAQLVDAASKAGGRPPRRPLARRWAAWSSFSGMVARMPRQRSSARLARELCLVSQHPVRSRAGPPHAKAWHPDAAQHRPELGAVAALAGGDHDRQGALATLDGQCSLLLSPPRERPRA